MKSVSPRDVQSAVASATDRPAQARIDSHDSADPALPGKRGGDDRSSRDVVVNAIIDGLYGGVYAPGARLVEAQLTTDFGVSRGPVREALNRLEALGIVSLSANRGAEIRKLTIVEAIDTLTVMQTLVALAARLAAEHGMAAADRAGIDAILDRLKRTPDGPEAWADTAIARDGFYAKLIDIAGNAELRRVTSAAHIHLVRVQFAIETQLVDRYRHADYRAIAKAVEAGSPIRAAAAVQRHFQRGIDILRALATRPSYR